MVTIDTNLLHNAPVPYRNFAFNSMGRHPAGFYVGANENGLYVLEGATDDGTVFNASFVLPLNDLGVHNKKRLRFIYLGIEGQGTVRISVSFDERMGVTMDVVIPGTQQQSYIRVPCPRSAQGRYLRLSITGLNGAKFAIDSISVLPVVLAAGIAAY